MAEILNLEPVDAISISIVADNLSDMLLVNQGPARRVGVASGASPPTVDAPLLEGGRTIDGLEAQHGFSAFVGVEKDGVQHRLLFDAGMTPDGAVENMRRLSLSPKDLEAIVLSHGHFDHTVGLDGLVRTLGRVNLPVTLHPESWSHRRLAIPGRDPIEIPTTSRSALLGAGFEIIESRQPSFLFERSVLITGEVDRTTEFERGFPIHQARRNGEWKPDPLILDDQALVANVRDKGLVVLTGCGHAGIVNTVRYARKLTGIDEIHAVIGGFHLSGPLFEPIIAETSRALAELNPRHVVPTHCTGWKAAHAMSHVMPDAFIISSVGTTFVL